MHHRFGRDWPEVYRVIGGCMFTYDAEYYRLQRKEHYEERKASLKWCLEHWEHDGHGYFTYRRQKEGDWLLSRTDLEQYHGISYTFHYREQLQQRLEREAWRPVQLDAVLLAEQLVLDL